jgi:putative effector of murein hydrolase
MTPVPALAALLPLAGTLLAFEVGLLLQRRFRGTPLANPVLIAVVLVACCLAATATPTTTYLDGVSPLGLLLGPATVALAIPLFRCLPRIREALLPILVGVVIGSIVASVSAVGIAAALGAGDVVVRSIASKSVTAAISMAVAREIGGDPVLATGLSVLTGISGAILCTLVFDLAGVRDARARGIAAGIAAHGIGTARMLSLNAEAGAFSGLAMGLAGFVAGIGIPLAAHFIPT